jgi:2-(1,2-epoxy-1,2-dihydrophenyl)acetyl-CoA isomerase
MSCPDRPQPGASVQHWREGAIARIHFNRPQALNAIDTAVAAGFLRACEDIAADAAVRAVWLSGEGRAFMAGGDLAEMQRDPQPVARSLIAGMHGGLRLLERLDASVVASVQGAVAGGGLGLTLGCDLVIAAEGTRFSMAYPQIGASCDCSTSWGLPRIVGLRKAMELALLGPVIDAAEALNLGLCNRVVPADELQTQTRGIVERLANGPTRAFGQLKRLLRDSLQNDLDAQLDAEAVGFQTSAATADFGEGVAAFLEKRSPRFVGR